MSIETATRAPRQGDPSATAHYVRLSFALVGLVVVFLLIRSLVVPESFGEEGHYRAAALQEIVAQETKFVGSFSCGDCHAERVATYAKGKHGKFECEACHGTAGGHLTTVDIERVPLAVNREHTACLQCHESIAGRPASQPQIDPVAHAEDNGFELEGAVCLDCHNVED